MTGPLLAGRTRRASFDADKYAMTVDGNSISAVGDLIAQLAALPPISSRFVITNKAVNGQSTVDMIASAADVDNAYVNGKCNVLLVWELTNNIHGDGRTGEQTIADTIAYIAARQANVKANRPGQLPWLVVLMTGIPRNANLNAYTAAQGEVHMQYCNAYIRANYRAMGAVAYVEARRPGGPFDFTDVTNNARYPAILWTDKTHPSSAGKAILAQYIADELARLPEPQVATAFVSADLAISYAIDAAALVSADLAVSYAIDPLNLVSADLAISYSIGDGVTMSFPPSPSRTLTVSPTSKALTGGPWFNLNNPAKPRATKDPQAVLDITLNWAPWLADIGNPAIARFTATIYGVTQVGAFAQGALTTMVVSGGTTGEATITFEIETATTPPLKDERTVYIDLVNL